VGVRAQAACDPQAVAPDNRRRHAAARQVGLNDYFLPFKHGGFPVVFGDHLIGIVTLQDVAAVQTERQAGTTIREIMTPRERLKTVSVNDSAYAAFARMSQDAVGRLLVLDEDGTLSGIVTRSDLLHVLRLRVDVDT